MAIRHALETLLTGAALTAPLTEAVFEDLLSGRLDGHQIAALLTLIQTRPVTVDELVGAARAMRRHVAAIPFTPPPGAVLIDTCGTGGAPKTFNISTLAAIVAAAAGAGRILVAKHGNRSRTGRGSAELLAALGVNVNAPPEIQARCLRDTGVCFCFAIHHHPAARHAAPVRASLGFPTIFNLLGPLTNPAGADRQLIGVYSPALVAPVAQALAQLGARRAIVAHAMDGLDELSTTAPTAIAHVGENGVGHDVIDAQAVGLPRASLADLAAGDLDHAVGIARSVLSGAPGPAADIVALNAGAALLIGGAAQDLTAGVHLAVGALQSGLAARTLGDLVEASRTS